MGANAAKADYNDKGGAKIREARRSKERGRASQLLVDEFYVDWAQQVIS